MGARGIMQMRAEVSRPVSSHVDDWGRDAPPEFLFTATVPCRVWSKTSKVARDDGKVAVIEDMRCIMPVASREASHGWVSGWVEPQWVDLGATFPVSTNVSVGDRLVITDRLGRILFDGPLAVEHITRRRGSSSLSGHLELMLTRHV